MKKVNKFIKAGATALVITSAMFLTSCSDMFEKRILVNPYAAEYTLGSLIRIDEVGQLDTPDQLLISQNEYSKQIKLSWDPVENATSYKIQRACGTTDEIPDESSFTTIQNYCYSTTFTDNSILPNDAKYNAEEFNYKYYYRVCAQNKVKGYKTSDFTDYEANGGQYGTLLKPVVLKTASKGVSEDSIRVEWDSVPGAYSYDIYRTTDENGYNATKVMNVSGNLKSYSFNVPETERGVQFYYFVVAVTKNSSSSIQGNLGLGYARKAGAPDKPVMDLSDTKVYRATSGTIRVNWKASDDTEVHYTVYYSTDDDPSLNMLCADTQQDYYTWANPKAGVFYYFTVLPWKLNAEGTKEYGPSSTEVYQGFVLGPTKNATVTKNTDGSQKLVFEQSIGSEEEQAAYAYKLYGSDTNGNDYVVTGDEATNATLDPATGLIVMTIPAGNTKKFYKLVTAYKVESKPSKVFSPVPYQVKSVTVTRNGFLPNGTVSPYQPEYYDEQGVSRETKSGIMPVVVSWEASDARDAEGYNIWRSIYPDKGFVRINEETLTANTTVFIDYSNEEALSANPKIDTNYQGKYLAYNSKQYKGSVFFYLIQPVNSLDQGEAVKLLSSTSNNKNWGYGSLCAEQFMRVYDKSNIGAQKRSAYLTQTDDMAKMPDGTEYIPGKLSGTLAYSSVVSMSPLGAKIYMHFQDYADFGITLPDGSTVFITKHTGDTNTVAHSDRSGEMNGTCTMEDCFYTGVINYDAIRIANSNVGGGFFAVSSGPYEAVNVSYKVGLEGR